MFDHMFENVWKIFQCSWISVQIWVFKYIISNGQKFSMAINIDSSKVGPTQHLAIKLNCDALTGGSYKDCCGKV